MFKKVRLITLLSLCLVTLLGMGKVLFLRSSDIQYYHNLLSKNKQKAAMKNYASADQKRNGVQKDLWVTQETNDRLHYQIKSTSSVLTFLPKEEKLDIVENLKGIKCQMQDKLYLVGNEQMQQIRYFEADQGIYRYTSQEFVANTVELSFFRLPGFFLPPVLNQGNAFLKGEADNVSFSISGKNPQFQADRFHATVKRGG